MQSIAVIIPTLGRMFWVLQLVNALLHGNRQPDEVIIVDQTPTAERSPIAYNELKVLLEQAKVAYVFSDRKGAALARNLGAEIAQSELFVFLDDDVFIPDCFLKEYARIFSDESTHAATGMTLVHSKDDGTFKPLVRQESKPSNSAMLRGGNFAIRRDVYGELGGMDERFLRACQHEDWDLAWRLEKGGFKVVWDPGPWCYHAATGYGGGRWVNFRAQADRAYNVSYFFLRNPQALKRGESVVRYLTRQFLFNRYNVLHPWVVPFRTFVTLRSYRKARSAFREGPILPLAGEPVMDHIQKGQHD